MSPADNRRRPRILDPLEQLARAYRNFLIIAKVKAAFVVCGVNAIFGEAVVVD